MSKPYPYIRVRTGDWRSGPKRAWNWEGYDWFARKDSAVAVPSSSPRISTISKVGYRRCPSSYLIHHPAPSCYMYVMQLFATAHRLLPIFSNKPHVKLQKMSNADKWAMEFVSCWAAGCPVPVPVNKKGSFRWLLCFPLFIHLKFPLKPVFAQSAFPSVSFGYEFVIHIVLPVLFYSL